MIEPVSQLFLQRWRSRQHFWRWLRLPLLRKILRGLARGTILVAGQIGRQKKMVRKTEVFEISFGQRRATRFLIYPNAASATFPPDILFVPRFIVHGYATNVLAVALSYLQVGGRAPTDL